MRPPDIKNQVFKFYCVACNLERRQYCPAKVGSLRFFIQIACTVGFLTVLTWPWFHAKGFFAFLIPVGLGLEAFSRMKLRASLTCPRCNFDPTLYLSNRPNALRQVESAWRAKFKEKNLPYPEHGRARPVSKKSSPSENLTSI